MIDCQLKGAAQLPLLADHGRMSDDLLRGKTTLTGVAPYKAGDSTAINSRRSTTMIAAPVTTRLGRPGR